MQKLSDDVLYIAQRHSFDHFMSIKKIKHLQEDFERLYNVYTRYLITICKSMSDFIYYFNVYLRNLKIKRRNLILSKFQCRLIKLL